MEVPLIYSILLGLCITFVISISFYGYSLRFEKISYPSLFFLFPTALCLFSRFLNPNIILIIGVLFVFIGNILAIKYWKLSFEIPTDKWKRFGLFLLVLYLLGFFFKSFFPHAITDPIIYHLQAAKEWALFLNGDHFNPQNPVIYQTGYYEYFYYFFFLCAKPLLVYFGTKTSSGFEAILFHLLILSQIFTAHIAYFVLPRLLPRPWITIPLIFGMVLFTWIWPAAKNDAIPYIGILVAYSFFKKEQFLLSGLISGIALGMKITNALPFVFITLVLIYRYRPKFNSMTKIAIGIAIGIIPILWRNWLEAQNPFFSTATAFFPNIYFSQSGYDYLASFSHHSNWSAAWDKCIKILFSSWSLIPISIYALIRGPRLFTIYVAISFIVIAKITGADLAHRTYSMILFLVGLWITQIWDSSSRQARITLLVVVILNCHAQVENIVKIPYKFASKSIHKIINHPKALYPFFEDNFKFNLENHQHFGKLVTKSVGGGRDYFSRFQFINIQDSNITNLH